MTLNAGWLERRIAKIERQVEAYNKAAAGTPAPDFTPMQQPEPVVWHNYPDMFAGDRWDGTAGTVRLTVEYRETHEGWRLFLALAWQVPRLWEFDSGWCKSEKRFDYGTTVEQAQALGEQAAARINEMLADGC